MPEVQWLFVVLAFVAAAAGAYVLGSWRERARGVEALQRATAEAASWRQLQRDALWQTDAAHALVLWQAAPGDARPRPDGARLATLLASERPFRDLRLPACDGAAGWLIDGEPMRDGRGRFAGFRGCARPAADAEDTSLTRDVLADVVAAWPGPALLAAGAAGRRQVLRFNDAARAHWPRLQAGADFEPLVSALPAQVAHSLAAQKPAQVDRAEAWDDFEGWRVLHFAFEPGREGLLLARAASATGAESDDFGPTLSHDLRAPIRVVEGFTRIVKEDYGRHLDRVANGHLDRVLGAAARMNLMIDALLALARVSSQPLARQPVNLSQLAAFVVDDLRRGAPEREVDVDIEPGLIAQGDPTLLRMVLENLLGNAWKYTARVPQAHIALERIEQDGRPGFQVTDNGAGFDMRAADRLFGLFQRLHSQSDFPGHGVGLASVRRIVHRHGGEIWGRGEPGRGATFGFTLT